jgi:Mce-associated membrane protein
MTAETTDRSDEMNGTAGDALDYPEGSALEIADADAELDHGHIDESTSGAAATRSLPAHRASTVVVLVMVLMLGALVGWLGHRVHQSQQTSQQHADFVHAARQAAINLTTVDWQHVEADVQRIVDSASGPFRDEFTKRSQPFADVVKQAQSKSEGTVAAAGLESVDGEQARVLVAVNVKTTNAGVQEPRPRAWRMRIDVQKVDNDIKVANVEFVP